MTAAPTPLQAKTLTLAALLLDARDTLDDAAYEAFVAVTVLAIEREAGRLLLGEALRALRGDS